MSSANLIPLSHPERSRTIRWRIVRRSRGTCSAGQVLSQVARSVIAPKGTHVSVRKYSLKKDSRGQSVLETALMLPFLLTLFLNAVNFGYFLLVTLNLTSATRSGIEWAISGSSTPVNGALPQTTGSATAVSSLVLQDLGKLNGGTLAVQVCSLSKGSSGGAAPTTQCDTFGSPPGTPTPDPDPEAATYPGFALNRVDVWYTFKPIVPATPFTLAVLTMPACTSSAGTTTCTFTRHAEMRAMGS